jgi:hypothetical protein
MDSSWYSISEHAYRKYKHKRAFTDKVERNCHFLASDWNLMSHREALEGFPYRVNYRSTKKLKSTYQNNSSSCPGPGSGSCVQLCQWTHCSVKKSKWRHKHNEHSQLKNYARSQTKDFKVVRNFSSICNGKKLNRKWLAYRDYVQNSSRPNVQHRLFTVSCTITCFLAVVKYDNAN